MRIWDIDPGFLNNQSLLGEHRELHGIISIVVNQKKGYSRHPETLRWKPHIGNLCIRHELLVEEMKLRGFNHHSPVNGTDENAEWPGYFIDEPGEQFALLRTKYVHREHGRIPLPGSIHQLWANHKYSVMAREPKKYKQLGQQVASKELAFYELALILVNILRIKPPQQRLLNAVEHMWGYISKYSSARNPKNGAVQTLREIQRLAIEHQVVYLMHSTALGELAYWSRTK
jgi:uncharacterized protein YbgA (DUF1722 family)